VTLGRREAPVGASRAAEVPTPPLGEPSRAAPAAALDPLRYRRPNTASKAARDFRIPMRSRNRSPAARDRGSLSRFRACWATMRLGDRLHHRRTWTWRVSGLDKKHLDPLDEHGVDGEEVAARIVCACRSASASLTRAAAEWQPGGRGPAGQSPSHTRTTNPLPPSAIDRFPILITASPSSSAASGAGHLGTPCTRRNQHVRTPIPLATRRGSSMAA